MTRVLLACTASLVLASTTLAAQSREEVKAEPIAKLQPGATAVPGQCLTQQELALIAALAALRRPTVGVEGEDEGDDPAPFDPHYFVGRWEFEGVLPDSPLGESGEFVGIETIRYVQGCTYESRTVATIAEQEVRISSRLIYDRRAGYLVRIEEDSRGFQLVKVGSVGGDPGGIFSHYWEAPAIRRGGLDVRLKGRTFLSSPDAFRNRSQISVDDGPFVSFGTVRWRRLEVEP